MNLKNRSYMEGDEFLARQSWFEFVCVEAFEFVKRFAAECRKGWQELFWPRKPRAVNNTLPLPFERRLSHLELLLKKCGFGTKTETA